MSNATHTQANGHTDLTEGAHTVRAHGDETKASFKTTELIVYVLAVIGVLVASKMLGDGPGENGADYFAADKAWWYITLLTIGYMVSRGLAKSGSRSRDIDPRNNR